MLATIDQILRDPRDNTQLVVQESVTLVETEIDIPTTNFYPSYLVPTFPDEDVENADEDPSQAFFWTEEWQQAEAESSEDIRLDKVKTFNSVRDLIGELES